MRRIPGHLHASTHHPPGRDGTGESDGQCQMSQPSTTCQFYIVWVPAKIAHQRHVVVVRLVIWDLFYHCLGVVFIGVRASTLVRTGSEPGGGEGPSPGMARTQPSDGLPCGPEGLHRGVSQSSGTLSELSS